MDSNNAIKKLQSDDDNDNVATRLLMLAEQLRTASAELNEVVAVIRRDRENEALIRHKAEAERRGHGTK